MRTSAKYGVLAITTLTTLAVAFLIWSPGTLTPNPAASHGTIDILICDPPATSGGDNARLRGIRFSVDQPFDAIEMRFFSDMDGTVQFDTLIRHSSGFAVPPEATAPVSVDLLAEGGPPYTTIHMDFPQVPVAGTETFTLAFDNVSSPGDTGVFYEVQANSPDLCSDVAATNENNVEIPTVRGSEPYLKVLGLPEPSATPVLGQRHWGDHDCDDDIDSLDALRSLRFTAGLPLEPKIACLYFGQTVDVSPADLGLITWGDVDCDGSMTAVDALVLLRSVAALPFSQEPGCPEVGVAVFATGPGK